MTDFRSGSYRWSLVGAALAAALGAPALAQEQSAEAPAPLDEPAGPEVSLSLHGGLRHTFRADLDDDEGDVAITRAAAGVDVAFAPGEKLSLNLGLNNEASWYDFETDGATSFEGVLEEALEHELSLRATWSLTDTTSLIAIGAINAGYEPGADFGESLTYMGGVAYGFEVNDRLSLNLGVAVRSRLEDDVLVLPILIANWRINEQATLGTEGLGARLTIALNERTDFYLRAGAELREYRLEDGNDALPEGVLSDYRVPVALGVTWEPGDGLRVTFEGGAVVWQEFELRDDDDEVGDTNTDPSAFVGVRVSWTF